MSDSLENRLINAQEAAEIDDVDVDLGSPDESQNAVVSSIQGLRLTLDEYGDQVQMQLMNDGLLLRSASNQGKTLDGQTRLLYALDQKLDRVLALLEASPKVPAGS